MDKHSYKLPRSTPPAASNGGSNAVSSDPASAGTKRRRGRPRKIGTDTLQSAVPVFALEMDMDVVPAADPAEEAPQGGTDSADATVRGRGRPPKLIGFRRKPGRPPKMPPGSRGRGRPRKISITDFQTQVKGPANPRGRPPRAVNSPEVVATAAVSGDVDIDSVHAYGDEVPTVIVKRKGRPPKEPKSPRKLSGKPLGRPRKSGASPIVNPTPDSQLLVAYLDLKGKLENLQSRVANTAIVIMPCLKNEAAIHALEELQLLALNVNVTPNVQEQQPTQPEQPTPDCTEE